MSASATATYEWNQIWRPAGGRGVQARTADLQSLARGRYPKSPQTPETPLEVAGGETARRPSRHPRQPREAHGGNRRRQIAHPRQRYALAEAQERCPSAAPPDGYGFRSRAPTNDAHVDSHAHDRALQARQTRLEPEWEARFEPNSYGFRPGRSVHDAIGAIFIAIENNPSTPWTPISRNAGHIDQQPSWASSKTFPTLTEE